MVMSLNGLLHEDELGIVLPHEHLIIQGWQHDSPNYLNSARMELDKFTLLGGKTIVDVSSTGLPCDPLFYKALADRTGVQVVLGTGFYKEAWLPPEALVMSCEEMAEKMIADIMLGFGDTGIHAGVIGEMGVSTPMSTSEAKALLAAARAQQATGAGISLHFELHTVLPQYLAALDLLESEGADLKRVAVGHLISRPDKLEIVQQIAQRGCWIEFDLFGQERSLLMDDLMRTHPDVQASSIKGFIDHGLLDHILLSQNVNHVDLMTVNGGDGYAHLLKNVIPRIQSYGVLDDQVQTMLVANPRRFLQLQ
jgi:phosphotriesterase-related protein